MLAFLDTVLGAAGNTESELFFKLLLEDAADFDDEARLLAELELNEDELATELLLDAELVLDDARLLLIAEELTLDDDATLLMDDELAFDEGTLLATNDELALDDAMLLTADAELTLLLLELLTISEDALEVLEGAELLLIAELVLLGSDELMPMLLVLLEEAVLDGVELLLGAELKILDAEDLITTEDTEEEDGVDEERGADDWLFGITELEMLDVIELNADDLVLDVGKLAAELLVEKALLKLLLVIADNEKPDEDVVDALLLLVERLLLELVAALGVDELALLNEDELGNTTSSPAFELVIELAELLDVAVLLASELDDVELGSSSAASFPVETVLLALLPKLVCRDDDAGDEVLLETATALLSVFCTAVLDDFSVDKLTLPLLPPPPHPVRITRVNKLVGSQDKLLFLVNIM